MKNRSRIRRFPLFSTCCARASAAAHPRPPIASSTLPRGYPCVSLTSLGWNLSLSRAPSAISNASARHARPRTAVRSCPNPPTARSQPFPALPRLFSQLRRCSFHWWKSTRTHPSRLSPTQPGCRRLLSWSRGLRKHFRRTRQPCCRRSIASTCAFCRPKWRRQWRRSRTVWAFRITRPLPPTCHTLPMRPPPAQGQSHNSQCTTPPRSHRSSRTGSTWDRRLFRHLRPSFTRPRTAHPNPRLRRACHRVRPRGRRWTKRIVLCRSGFGGLPSLSTSTIGDTTCTTTGASGRRSDGKLLRAETLGMCGVAFTNRRRGRGASRA
eukprot:Opistho-1_new@39833